LFNIESVKNNFSSQLYRLTL